MFFLKNLFLFLAIDLGINLNGSDRASQGKD